MQNAINSPTDVYGLVKPKLRGLVHAWTIGPFVAASLLLVLFTPEAGARVAVSLYALAITAMLTASALYHRLNVSERARTWLRRVDHSTIGVAVAGTYTPIVALVAEGSTKWALLGLLWIGALGGLVLTLAWPQGPRWIRAGLYIALGWAGVAVMPALIREAGMTAFWLAALGGVLYTVGAVIYALRKPNFSEHWFGFHELFHSFVVAAVIAHFATVASVVAQTT